MSTTSVQVARMALGGDNPFGPVAAFPDRFCRFFLIHFESFIVQASVTILWSFAALALMVVGARLMRRWL